MKKLMLVPFAFVVQAGCVASAEPARIPCSKLQVRKVHLVGLHEGYTVDVTYPQFQGGAAAIVSTLNSAAKRVRPVLPVVGMTLPV